MAKYVGRLLFWMESNSCSTWKKTFIRTLTPDNLWILESDGKALVGPTCSCNLKLGHAPGR